MTQLWEVEDDGEIEGDLDMDDWEKQLIEEETGFANERVAARRAQGKAKVEADLAKKKREAELHAQIENAAAEYQKLVEASNFDPLDRRRSNLATQIRAAEKELQELRPKPQEKLPGWIMGVKVIGESGGTKGGDGSPIF